MSYIVSITSQGQISIPAKLRRKLKMDKNRKAVVNEESGKIIIEPVKDLLELAGSLKTSKKPLSNKKLHELFATSVAKDYASKLE